MTLGELIATNQCSRLKKRLCSSYSILTLKKKENYIILLPINLVLKSQYQGTKIMTKSETRLSYLIILMDIYKNKETNHGLSLNIVKYPIELMHVHIPFSFH